MDFIAVIEAEGHALAAAARREPTAPVPTCPGWSVTQLVGHTGEAHRWAANGVRSGSTSRPDIEPAPADGVLEWFDDGVGALVDTLRSHDPAQAAWTFDAGNRTASFWHRRMAHETAVHRVDADLATGEPQPVGAALARDGIDEVLGVFVPMLVKRGREVPSSGETVHLHCTDVDGEWLIAFDGALTVSEGHAKGDAAARGTASDLYLWLWGRAPTDRLEVFGDDALLARLREVATI